MSTFLEQVAGYLYENHRKQFADVLLVVPNRRTGVFLTEALKKQANESIWLPDIKTINEFIQDYSVLTVAEPVSLLAHLYKVYIKASGAAESFDEFYFWGEMMLADFDNVDKYLANPHAVFKNVKDFKELDNPIDFLTKEQIEIIKKFFTDFDLEKKSVLKEQFLEIWKVLLPVYQQFTQNLKEQGIGYEGMIYREAVDKINGMPAEAFQFSKVFFIGFNAITRCEEAVFESLQNRKLAGFFWDYDAFYTDNTDMEAGYFIRKYLKRFPPPITLEQHNFSQKKDIQIVSVSTDAGQMEYSARQLQKKNTDNYSQTALVLVDEQLLVPMLNFLPKKVDEVNVTMGYPLMNSNTGRFVDLLIELQKRTRTDKSSGKEAFYHKIVLPLLRHPFFMLEPDEEITDIKDKIATENLFYISPDDLGENAFIRKVFKPVGSGSEWHSYLSDILQYLLKRLVEQPTASEHLKLDMEFLYHLHLKTNQLSDEITRHKLDLQMPTLFSLYRRMVNSVRIPFEGEPVKGLQMMGFLETRNLDFEEVIVLSVNEGLLPATTVSPSFIPYSLKRGFGLPTREQHDAMYAYYFYRLLQRAKKITLIYNDGAQGMTTGEKSRLLHQLNYNQDLLVTHHAVKQTVDLKVKPEITIDKTGKVWEKLSEYLENPEKKLSPSALTAYLTCSLKFYYRSVLNLHPNDEIEEAVDARLFGNIFHYAAEKVYQPFLEKNVLVDEPAITRLLSDKKELNKIIEGAFREAFYGKDSNRRFIIEGKNLLVYQVIEKYLKGLLAIDKKYAPLSVIGLETNVKATINFSINNKPLAVNIGGQIDRIDRTDKGLRVIDYKTGSDKLYFNDLSEVFDREKIAERKAVFQTFIYSLICHLNTPAEPVIIPGVYQVKDFFSNNGFTIQGRKEPAFASGNFIDIADEVHNKLKNLLAELFDERIPFTQTEAVKRCEYCPYRVMCGR